MFARVSTIRGRPQAVEEGVRDYRENLVPAVRKMAGFKGAYMLVDRGSGKVMSITLWDSERAMQDSAAAADRLRAQGARVASASDAPAVEVFEVAVLEQPAMVP